MQCCLWLFGKKIYNADEIKDNFDIASLEGYLRGGSLIRWLQAHGGEGSAAYLNNISPDCNVSTELKYAFGLELPQENTYIGERNTPVEHNADVGTTCEKISDITGSFSLSSYFSASDSALSSAGSGSELLAGITSYLNGVFGSGLTAGMIAGLFSSGSLSSFFVGGTSGSYRICDIIGALAVDGAIREYCGQTGMSENDDEAFFEEHSRQIEALLELYATEEYRQLHLNLSSDPLNMYGYGIHLV